jgi:hypothetical protein
VTFVTLPSSYLPPKIALRVRVSSWQHGHGCMAMSACKFPLNRKSKSGKFSKMHAA